MLYLCGFEGLFIWVRFPSRAFLLSEGRLLINDLDRQDAAVQRGIIHISFPDAFHITKDTVTDKNIDRFRTLFCRIKFEIIESTGLNVQGICDSLIVVGSNIIAIHPEIVIFGSCTDRIIFRLTDDVRL